MAIARLGVTALDCPDPRALAEFYSAITGWPVETEPAENDWIELVNPNGATLAFQRVPDHVAPTWPDGPRPQQVHLDFEVPDLDEGERQVVRLGASRHEVQPGTTFRVFVDPAGHPFCLVLST